MTYCSVCGIRYENAGRICTGCGNELGKTTEQAADDRPLYEDSTVLNPAPINDLEVPGRGLDPDQESQLGKGLIKPYAIELEIDGVHFKYDKPVRNFAKHENIKEKVVEFRVSCPDSGTPSLKETGEDTANPVGEESQIPQEHALLPISQAVISGEGTLEETISELNDGAPGLAGQKNAADEDAVPGPASETVQEGFQNPITGDEKLAKQEIPPVAEVAETVPEDTVPPEPILENTPEIFLEPELVPEIELPEPELESQEDKLILWEDHRRWFGIPLNYQYRISNRSLQIIDRLARKFSEVDLTLISEVRLRQSWLDKIFNTGELTVFVKHLPDTGMKLSGIRYPEKVRRLLEEQIQI